MVRPEIVRLGREGVFNATVTFSTYMGPSQEYVVDLNGHSLQIEDTDPTGRERFAEGGNVKLSFKQEGLHIVKKR